MTERNMVASGKALCILRKLNTGEQQIISPIYTNKENAKKRYDETVKQYSSDKEWCDRIGLDSLELVSITLNAIEKYNNK